MFGAKPKAPPAYKVSLTEAEWRRRLPAPAYRVLRQQGTEAPYTSPLNKEHRAGVFKCAGCATPLYASRDKFDSGTGWPSFTRPVADKAIARTVDRSLFMVRTEVHCATCGGHLGHVFADGPPPTGMRHCINGVALTFQRA